MRSAVALLVIATLATAACRPEAPAPTPLPASPAGAASNVAPGVVTLAARIDAAGAAGVTGAVVLTEEAGRLIVAAALDGLAPGPYLVHVYSGSDCDEPDRRSPRRVLGTFEADATGQVRFSVERADPEGPAAYVGRAVAVHARGADGSTGALAGCGLLRPIAR